MEVMTSATVEQALQNLGLNNVDAQYLDAEKAEAQIDSDVAELKQAIQHFLNSDLKVTETILRSKFKQSLYCGFLIWRL